MIGMVMRENYRIRTSERKPRLRHANDRPTATINQDPFMTSFDHSAGAKSLYIRIWDPRTKKRYSQCICFRVHEISHL